MQEGDNATLGSYLGMSPPGTFPPECATFRSPSLCRLQPFRPSLRPLAASATLHLVPGLRGLFFPERVENIVGPVADV